MCTAEAAAVSHRRGSNLMKKLLTVLVIFVLGFAAIILVLKMNEENANSSLTTILNSSESETTGEIVSETSPLPTPSPEPVTIPEQIDETLPGHPVPPG